MINEGVFLWGLFTMGVKIYYFIYIYDIICNTDICIIVSKFLQLAPPNTKIKNKKILQLDFGPKFYSSRNGNRV